MKYTLQEIQIKVLEELQEKHDNLMKYWKENKSDDSLISSMSDILKTSENMKDLFNELIEEESNPEQEEEITRDEYINDMEMQREMDR